MADNNRKSYLPEDEEPRGPSSSRCCRLQSPSLPLRTILLLSLLNFLTLAAYGPIESLQSSLNSKAGLGALSLACVYGPYFIFAMGSPVLVRLLTPKWTMFSSWTCDLVYIMANFYPTWWTLIPASVLNGIMTGPLWTTKDLYVSQMARRSLDPNADGFDEKYQGTLSFYNGIIFAGFSLAKVAGQLISSVILTQSSATTPSSVCGAFNCQEEVTLYNNATNQTLLSTLPEKSVVYMLLGVLLSLIVLAMLLMTLLLQQIPSGNQNASFLKTLTSCARRVTDVRMVLMIPQIVLFGFYQGTIMADYTKSYITCAAGVGMVGYIMTWQGVTATLASVVCGRLVKYTGRPIQAFAALLGFIAVTLMLWLWVPSKSHLVMFFVTPVVYGISDVVFQTHICTILALLFPEDSASAFANFYTFRALSKALSFGLSAFVCVWIKLSIASVLLALGCGSFVILEFLVKCEKSNSKEVAALEVMLEPTVNNENTSKDG